MGLYSAYLFHFISIFVKHKYLKLSMLPKLSNVIMDFDCTYAYYALVCIYSLTLWIY